MSSKIIWLLLVMLLSIATFGLWMCCIIVVTGTSALIGFLLIHYCGTPFRMPTNFDALKNTEKKTFPFLGIPKVVIHMNKQSRSPKIDQRLTGSTEIDSQLKEIISNIVRDFLQTWYQEVSPDEDFLIGFNEICKRLINNFSISSKEVNWISFFTQRVVEDFTSHLRLFRNAEIAFRKKQRESPEGHLTVESIFFNKETDFDKDICRENTCSSTENEYEYLQCICDVLLYLLLPPEDFNNKIFKTFLREVLASSVLQPVLSQFSDPDVINQNLIWMCKDYLVTSKALLTVLRRTDNPEELAAFLQISRHELKVQNSKDSGEKEERKKYMKSISFVQNVARARYERLLGHSKHTDSDSAEFFLDFDSTDAPTFERKDKLVSLPFDVILNNNVALHYFTQYLFNEESEGYVFFYHHVQGFKTTVEMLQSDGITNGGQQSSGEKLKTLAVQLYESYLGPSAASKITLDEKLRRKLVSRLKTEDITESFFDEVQEKVYEILENEFYINGFKDSKMYVKLLAELDLLHDLSPSLDIDSLSSSRSEEEEKYNCDTVVPTDEEMLNELLTAEISTDATDGFPEMSSGPILDDLKEIGVLFAEVHSTGITHHAGRTFAVYAISVSHYRADGSEEKWFVVRRYSEFYDFHEAIITKYPILTSFNFPSKKPFNNLTRQLMEKRRHMLNEFIQFLLSPNNVAACDELKAMVYNFLQPNTIEKGKKSLVKTVGVGAFVNPIKSSVRSVGQFARLVPDTFFELKDGFVKTFFRHSDKDAIGDERPMTSKDSKTDDIPFRIMLLLMDEVFNLRNKDLWFRRRIMALLRQIIKTMQGGNINRKIKEYVQGMTSASQISEWLKVLSKSIWPDGCLAAPAPERDQNTKLRTRTVAKMLLFCAIPDELKHIIGFETSLKGAMLIFNMFQHPSLNRRLLLVLLESFLKTLFPKNNIPDLIQKLHSQSARLASASSVDKLSMEEQPFQEPLTPEIPKIIEESKLDFSNEKLVSHEKSTFSEKPPKEPKNKLKFLCLPQRKLSPSPKQRRRKKSSESAVFYTDLPSEEDTVILPLGR